MGVHARGASRILSCSSGRADECIRLRIRERNSIEPFRENDILAAHSILSTPSTCSKKGSYIGNQLFLVHNTEHVIISASHRRPRFRPFADTPRAGCVQERRSSGQVWRREQESPRAGAGKAAWARRWKRRPKRSSEPKEEARRWSAGQEREGRPLYRFRRGIPPALTPRLLLKNIAEREGGHTKREDAGGASTVTSVDVD